MVTDVAGRCGSTCPYGRMAISDSSVIDGSVNYPALNRESHISIHVLTVVVQGEKCDLLLYFSSYLMECA